MCDYVIESILPEIEPTQHITIHHLLSPICHTYQKLGEATASKALELYTMHVANPFAELGRNAHQALAHIVPPTMIIFKCCSSGGETYPNFKDDISFMLDGEKTKCPFWVEMSILGYHDLAFSTMCAEACLHLASLSGCDSQDKSALIKAGLQFLEVSEKAVLNEDGPRAAHDHDTCGTHSNIVSTTAYSYHSHILSELGSLEDNQVAATPKEPPAPS